jgi:hypothetical protein
MIDERLAQLSQATDRAIEALRRERRLEDVMQGVPERLARAAGCEWAAYWAVDVSSHRLHAVATWSALGPTGGRLELDVRVRALSMNQCAPGLVWRTLKPIWTSNIALTMCLPRCLNASEAGLRGGVWLAVKTDTAIYGVIELLAQTLPYKPSGALAALERIGLRLGYVLEELRNQQRSRLH